MFKFHSGSSVQQDDNIYQTKYKSQHELQCILVGTLPYDHKYHPAIKTTKLTHQGNNLLE